MIDPRPLWDFDDPAGSEARLRSAAATAEGDDRLVLLTQVARALGLQERYDDGHAVLDQVAASCGSSEVEVRLQLERGRLLRSSGAPADARPAFEAAAALAHDAGLEALQVDSLHMVALVAEPSEQLRIGLGALEVARGATDPAARDWDASLLNNLGTTHADAKDWPAALTSFEEALAACRRIGDPGRIRVARWMTGWALRNLGRLDEARAVQLALRDELRALGETDRYVEEELALLGGG